jgi:hypothetical protein
MLGSCGVGSFFVASAENAKKNKKIPEKFKKSRKVLAGCVKNLTCPPRCPEYSGPKKSRINSSIR